MQSKFILSALVAAVAAAVMPTQAFAYDVINTNAPSGGATGAIALDSSNWVAEKFALSADATVNSILTYVLSQDSGMDAGKSFTIALYGNTAGNLPSLNWNDDVAHGQLFHGNATYTTDGWTGLTGLNWNLSAGSYWVAVEVGSDFSSASNLLMPTGAVPAALAVANYMGGQSYALGSTADTFGLQITATPAVPEPSSLALMLASLAIMGVAIQRRAR